MSWALYKGTNQWRSTAGRALYKGTNQWKSTAGRALYKGTTQWRCTSQTASVLLFAASQAAASLKPSHPLKFFKLKTPFTEGNLLPRASSLTALRCWHCARQLAQPNISAL